MVAQRRTVAAYAAAAVLIRTADAAAIVGLVLLAASSPGSSAYAGFMAACLTAPHLAGPLIAPVLARSKRPKVLMACAFVAYALTVTVAALALAAGWVVLSLIVLVAAGLCGPMFTGGLSSQLVQLVSSGKGDQRRAQSLDALTYGAAAALGPFLVAVVASGITPLAGVLGAAAAALAATAALLTLPRLSPEAVGRGDRRAAGTARQSMALLFTAGPLRRVTLCTSLTAVAVGAVPVLAVAAADVHELGGRDAAALLAAAFGAGTLVGSLGLTVRPLRGSPERAVSAAALTASAALISSALVPTLVTGMLSFALVGMSSALQFASSLAARSEYSPPGARAQVFMTMAGLKVAFSSAGVAAAGMAVGSAPAAVLGSAAAVAAAAFTVAEFDRRRSRALAGCSTATAPKESERIHRGPSA